jgi:pseudouridine-5'-phosphate glycosidase
LAAAVTHARTAGTTVSATMFLAHMAGIHVFATGGIGGAHRGVDNTWDISADLIECARTPIAVICAGAKSILDIDRTLEIVETHGVPVVAFGTDMFPAFYARSSGRPVSVRVDTPDDAARLIAAHWSLGGAGVVIAQPVAEEVAIDAKELGDALRQADTDAAASGVRGPELTPFLLQRLAVLSNGQTTIANQKLVIANAVLAARIARALMNR